MQNYFISGLVAIFFWGKNSSKTVKKILEASWPRTFVYAFLCIVVFAFLYKTYEIATVYNMVQIVGVKHSSDSSGHVLDTAKISIVHKLSESSMQQGDINKMEIREISRHKEIDDVLNKYGGVYIDIMANAHPYEYKSRNILGMDQNAKQELKMQLDKNNIPSQKVNHFYQVGYIANDIPSIIPFYPLVSQEQDFKMKGDYMFYRKKKENSRNSSLIELIDDRTRGKEVPVKVENRNKGVKHSDILNNGICFVA